MSWLFLLFVVAVPLLGLFFSPTLRPMQLYVRVEEGNDSALYIRRVRRRVEYQRVTCAPNQSYTQAASGWFTPTLSVEDGRFLDTYAPLTPAQAALKWKEQKPVTEHVAKLLKRPRVDLYA